MADPYCGVNGMILGALCAGGAGEADGLGSEPLNIDFNFLSNSSVIFS
jgi:hypothetical protein